MSPAAKCPSLTQDANWSIVRSDMPKFRNASVACTVAIYTAQGRCTSDWRRERTRNPPGATPPSCNSVVFSGRMVTHHALDFRQISKNYLITNNFSFSFFRPDAAVPKKSATFGPYFGLDGHGERAYISTFAASHLLH